MKKNNIDMRIVLSRLFDIKHKYTHPNKKRINTIFIPLGD
jgi:hypothetical protein